MCTRYSLTSPNEAVRSYFRYEGGHEFPPRAQIRPTEPAVIVRNSQVGSRELTIVRWGLLPPWVKDPREFGTLLNARAETVFEKPSFRGAIRHKRCIVPANGFYEWSGEKGQKQCWFFAPNPRAPGGNAGLLALAGLYEHWLGADGSELETMAILTCEANSFMETVHDRMPVILAEQDFERWLDCRSGTAEDIQDLLVSAPDQSLVMRRVSPEELRSGSAPAG